MTCKLCLQEAQPIFQGTILGKYNAEYFFCPACEFLFAANPEQWLSEAYGSSIASEDTGIMLRNTVNSKRLTILLYFLLGKTRETVPCLDFAGGYGLLTRMMRDVGFDFYWTDAYSQNLVARGFEGSLDSQYQCLTAFECFEHLTDPLQEIERIAKLSRLIIFSTECLPRPIPK
jgi:2-polyprenyl-3-methyl-5-hydroxy-6-metoxy-1,4-benzoquinol methylase